MSGKQHMTIGTTISIILCLLAIYMKIWNVEVGIMLLIIGSVIGSYIPDIDAKKSKANQTFNKLLSISILIIGLFYFIYLKLNLNIFNNLINMFQSKIGVIMFIIVTFLSKLSPHRIFTHKFFGTSLFLVSVYLLGNRMFFIGFTIGYIMHIIADRFFTKNGEYLKFFEFKMPFVNSKGRISIHW